MRLTAGQATICEMMRADRSPLTRLIRFRPCGALERVGRAALRHTTPVRGIVRRGGAV
jgi:hypothetical protein